MVKRELIKKQIQLQNPLQEKVKMVLKKVIKVLTDKLGKKVVAYCEFPNGSNDK